MPVVLIVDDEEQNRIALRRDLSDRAPTWEVVAAASEMEAVRLATARSVDAVVTDLVMTDDHSGISVLREMKRIDPLVGVIIITAFEKHLDRYAAFEQGAFDCVQKNTPGVIASEEIFVKLKAALRFRELALQQIASSTRIEYLKRYFDPRVFGRLQSNPELLEPRRGIITIVFWDIRGFSKLSESLKAHPGLISGFLADYFDLAASVIFGASGVLDKYIGDGVMGLFGAIESPEDEGLLDAVSAVVAAIEFRQNFRVLLERWTERWALYTPEAISIGLGCGMHTGDVIVGNIGNGTRGQFTAIGPSVNLAARIEARASGDQILVSNSTAVRVRKRFATKHAGRIEDIKNIPGRFDLFSIEEAAGVGSPSMPNR